MKRFLPLLLGAFLALPLLADDPPAEPPADPPTDETAAAPAPTQPEVQPDSPLVAAAKRNGRGRMPAKVITNATVKASKGHLTTTKSQQPIALASTTAPADPKPKAKAAKPTAAKAAAEKAAAEKREARQATTAATAEEGMYEDVEDDPAEAEHAAEEAQKPPR
jgi:colicin import membrane protein